MIFSTCSVQQPPRWALCLTRSKVLLKPLRFLGSNRSCKQNILSSWVWGVLSTTSSGCSGYPHSVEVISLLWSPEACCLGKYTLTCFLFKPKPPGRPQWGKKLQTIIIMVKKTLNKSKARFQSHNAVPFWSNAAHRFRLFPANGTEHQQQGSPT